MVGMRTRGVSHLLLIIADGQEWCGALVKELAWERIVGLRVAVAACDNDAERAKLTRDLCKARALYDQVEGYDNGGSQGEG